MDDVDDVQAVRDVFRALDTSGDGRLGLDELRAAFEFAYARGEDGDDGRLGKKEEEEEEEEVRRLFDALDASGTGFVTEGEFVDAFVRSMSHSTSRQAMLSRASSFRSVYSADVSQVDAADDDDDEYGFVASSAVPLLLGNPSFYANVLRDPSRRQSSGVWALNRSPSQGGSLDEVLLSGQQDKRLQRQVDAMTRELDQANTRLRSTQDQLDTVVLEVERLQRVNEEVNGALERAQSDLAAQEESATVGRYTVEELRAALRSSRAKVEELNAAEARVAELEQQLDEFQAELRQARQRELEAREAALREDAAAEEAETLRREKLRCAARQRLSLGMLRAQLVRNLCECKRGVEQELEEARLRIDELQECVARLEATLEARDEELRSMAGQQHAMLAPSLAAQGVLEQSWASVDSEAGEFDYSFSTPMRGASGRAASPFAASPFSESDRESRRHDAKESLQEHEMDYSPAGLQPVHEAVSHPSMRTPQQPASIAVLLVRTVYELVLAAMLWANSRLAALESALVGGEAGVGIDAWPTAWRLEPAMFSRTKGSLFFSAFDLLVCVCATVLVLAPAVASAQCTVKLVRPGSTRCFVRRLAGVLTGVLPATVYVRSLLGLGLAVARQLEPRLP